MHGYITISATKDNDNTRLSVQEVTKFTYKFEKEYEIECSVEIE